MIILTHRGLEPSRKELYSESSYEAFRDHLQRGFGIEFDVNFTQDDQLIVIHDKDATRITQGKDKRPFNKIPVSELPPLANGNIPLFEQIMELIRKYQTPINALHLKGVYQKQSHLDLLLKQLTQYTDILPNLFIFDVKPEIAKQLKKSSPELFLAPSVVHPYDFLRYNNVVAKTLLSIKDAVKYKELYNWVWMDEWDLTDYNAGHKKLYTKQNFAILKQVGYKIAVITPELHRLSPGLLGNESHPDAENKKALFTRIAKIVSLKPDAICTDYPEETLKILQR